MRNIYLRLNQLGYDIHFSKYSLIVCFVTNIYIFLLVLFNVSSIVCIQLYQHLFKFELTQFGIVVTNIRKFLLKMWFKRCNRLHNYQNCLYGDILKSRVVLCALNRVNE